MSRAQDSKKFTASYVLYASTIFLSAFLIFAIQPIAGKYLLPWFGGSSSVWAVSLVFFTGMLFVGYLYVYILTTYGGKRQSLIHLVVTALVAVFAGGTFLTSYSLFPSLLWTVGDAAPPSFNVLLALLLAIGAPYLLLSTTGPLLQYWYGTSASKEPYRLCALSNLASLLALISYPFFIEPLIPLHNEGDIWMGLFCVYVVICAIVCIVSLRASKPAARHTDDVAASSPRTAVEWILLAAMPTFMLVATTTLTTQVIAPVPLLWIVPLTIYLVTLILAFSGFGRSIAVPLFLLAATIFAYMYIHALHTEIILQLSADLALLFFCGLAFHARLYALRPATAKLPLFYLLLSFGGMIGTLCASMLAPLIFSDFSEFPLGLALCAIFAGAVLDVGWFPRILDDNRIFLTRIVFTLSVATLFVSFILADTGAITSRNFYGVASVRFEDGLVELLHGSTLHGTQFSDKVSSYQPTTYYVPMSGVGRAIRYEQDALKKKPLRVGVIGLGTGTLASYCRAGDTYVFYEVDPRIPVLARQYFTYLAHCAGVSMREGDARILLEEERQAGTLGAYDVLAVDAFSDDTIPVHLLTLQALSLYAVHLRTAQSIIAVHTSNRFLRLAPVVLRLAAQLGMSATVVEDTGELEPGGTVSEWVLLTKDPSIFNAPAFANSSSALPSPTPYVWTDDYTSLIPIVDFPLPWK